MIEDEGPGVESVQAQQAEQLHVYWSYIQGMVRRSVLGDADVVAPQLGRAVRCALVRRH